MAHWTDDLLALPWKDKGRDRNGVDCWGLCRLAFAEKRHILLPSYHDSYATTIDGAVIERTISAEMTGLVLPVAEGDALPWDFVLMREGPRAVHVGLVAEDGRMLHIERSSTSRVQRWGDPEFRLRIVGFYRLVELADA